MAMKECLSALENSVLVLKIEEADRAKLSRVVSDMQHVVRDLSAISNYSEAEHRALSDSLDSMRTSCAALQKRG